MTKQDVTSLECFRWEALGKQNKRKEENVYNLSSSIPNTSILQKGKRFEYFLNPL